MMDRPKLRSEVRVTVTKGIPASNYIRYALADTIFLELGPEVKVSSGKDLKLNFHIGPKSNCKKAFMVSKN